MATHPYDKSRYIDLPVDVRFQSWLHVVNAAVVVDGTCESSWPRK